jgi:hypothetical protein
MHTRPYRLCPTGTRPVFGSSQKNPSGDRNSTAAGPFGSKVAAYNQTGAAEFW